MYSKITNIPVNSKYPQGEAEVLCENFGTFFLDKIDKIRNDINDILIEENIVYDLNLDKSDTLSSCLNHFNFVSEDEVRKKISSSNNKFCKLDPVPTNILKSCLDILLPFITYLINLSLSTGTFPKCWKSALLLFLLLKNPI